MIKFNLNYFNPFRYIFKFIQICRILYLKIFYPKRYQLSIFQNISFRTNISIQGKLCINGKITTLSGVKLSVRKNAILNIDNNVFFNSNIIITVRKKVHIGENSMFGPNVLIYDHDHKVIGKNIKSNEYDYGDVIIGKNCWIGANTIILRGTIIGDNTVIAAGSIVKGVFPKESMVYNKLDTRVVPLTNK